MIRRTAASVAFFFVLAAGASLAGEKADNHVVVVNDGVEEAYEKAIETLVETAWRGYVEDLKLPMPELITVNLSLDPGNRLRLFTDGKSQIFLDLNSMAQLRPCTESGVFNLYGFCHELGHIAMYHRLKTVDGIHSAVAEAWPTVTGAIVCDYVYSKKGKKLWPVPFDYKRHEGTARIRASMKKLASGRRKPSDHDLAVKGFWNLYLVAKKKKFFKAFDASLKDRPTGDRFLPLFLGELKKACGKRRLPEFFPERFMKKSFSWDPKPPDLEAEATFRDLKIEKGRKGGQVLCYFVSDPDPENRVSSAGTGYFQLFRLPSESGKLLSIEVFGARYGRRADDGEPVVVWVMAPDGSIVNEHRFTYGELNWGDTAWFTIPSFRPVEVKRHFLVGVFFDATATKGYYMGYQKDTSGHSYTGSAKSGLSLLKGRDWVMRVRVKADK
ncbi:MAG: hypothetical protein ACYS47_04810 [Planctomycetota bacterium]|jgi:hypothetical protein